MICQICPLIQLLFPLADTMQQGFQDYNLNCGKTREGSWMVEGIEILLSPLQFLLPMFAHAQPLIKLIIITANSDHFLFKKEN